MQTKPIDVTLLSSADSFKDIWASLCTPSEKEKMKAPPAVIILPYNPTQQ